MLSYKFVIILLITVLSGFTLNRIFNSKNINHNADHVPEAAQKLNKLSQKVDNLLTKVIENETKIDEIKQKNLQLLSSIDTKLKNMENLAAQPSIPKDDFVEPEPNDQHNNHLDDFIQREQQAYENEIVDFVWAPTAEASLTDGLDELAPHLHFDLLNSDCRSTRCSATVDFENYDLAAKYGTRLAEVMLPGLNCARSIALPVPGNTSVRYQANLILDCSQQIQEKAQPHSYR